MRRHLGKFRFRRYWLLLTLAGAIVITVPVGVVLYKRGSPPPLELSSVRSPPNVEVFVSDRSARVSLSVSMSPPDLDLPSQDSQPRAGGPLADVETGQWLGEIRLRVSPRKPRETVRWVVQVSGAVSDDAGHLPAARFISRHASRRPSAAAARKVGGPPTMHVFEGTSSTTNSRAPSRPASAIGYFVSEPFASSSGTLVARLPALAAGSLVVAQSPLEQQPALEIKATRSDLHTLIPDLPLGVLTGQRSSPSVLHQHLALKSTGTLTQQGYVDPNLPLNEVKLTGPGVLTRFYYPATIATEEQVDASLVDYEIGASYPAAATISPEALTWHGGAALGAVLTATASGAEDERARYSFLSGIALATAAAALIAFLQELRTALGHAGEASPEPHRQAEDPNWDPPDS